MSLFTIQQELKAPKNQRNKFGNYNYRSLEDIMEAIKPILAKTKCTLSFSDTVVAVGDGIFYEANAILRDEGGNTIGQSNGFAMHEASQKGMSGAQLTGSCSSYARKYACNALFLIDDVKDDDSTNKHDKATPPTTHTPQRRWKA